MPMFRRKPVVIEARQWNGGADQAALLCGWINGSDRTANYFHDGAVVKLDIVTLGGSHRAASGDWIIKDVAGEFYPCKPAIFDETYDPESNQGELHAYSR